MELVTKINLHDADRPKMIATTRGILIYQDVVGSKCFSLFIPAAVVAAWGRDWLVAIVEHTDKRLNWEAGHPEKPPCEPAPAATEDAPTPEASPDGTGEPAGDT